MEKSNGNKRDGCSIRRRRTGIQDEVVVDDNNWVFGEKIRWQLPDTPKPSFRSEIWLTKEEVKTKKPIQVRFKDWTHEIYEVPRLVSGTIDDYTTLIKIFEDMQLSQWPSYKQLLNGPDDNYIDELGWEHYGVAEQVEFDTLLTNLTKEI